MKKIEDIIKTAYLDKDRVVVALPFEIEQDRIKYGLYEIKSGSAFVVSSAKPQDFLIQYPVQLTSDLMDLLPRNTPLFGKLVSLAFVPYIEPRAEELTGQD